MSANNNDSKVVATFQSIGDAYITKGVLANEGVESWVINGLISTIYPVTSPDGGIRLIVRGEDYDRALEIINNMAD
ncbi:MAG: DUF2007 domain-containing protein [Bacteroides sp.]|nr:DUF2007 domain-containing protein [Bacteroidales bacterium]MBD5379961.1 DUF2007 domain-containing protein [Bacteroides sp.]MDE5809617.1 DUF2007 domain-containing protein [Muribaculaceae bacterium]